MRRFAHFQVKQLERQASAFPEDVPEIIRELHNHRNSEESRSLLQRLQAQVAKGERGAPVALPPNVTARERHRPDDWGQLFPFRATEEQERAVDAFITKQSMKITAFAGAGKTSTLQFLAKTAQNEQGLYLAFNKSIATAAAQTFARNVECRTTHSAALRHVRSNFKFADEKYFSSISSKQLVHAWRIQSVQLEPMSFRKDMVAFLYIDTVRRFCQTGDPEITKSHVLLTGRATGLREDERNEVASFVIKGAKRLWEEMNNPSSDIPLGHDGYLKLWSLMQPKLAYDFILLDEAQDTNGAVLSVLNDQACQLVYVGDRHQQIYEWRGAINAMEKANTTSENYLTMSFRFGPELAVEANKILEALGEKETVRGSETIETRIEHQGFARTVLTRTNASVFQNALYALEDGLMPHVIGGTETLEKLLTDVELLKKGQPGTQPEFFGFTSWKQVIAFSEEPEGATLKPFVDLVDRFGTEALWKAIKSCTEDEDDADIILSTAHRSKGREWNSVRISSDFDIPWRTDENEANAEARLFYVAITRAKRHLVIPDGLTEIVLNRMVTKKVEQERGASGN